jgi:hypothetical protein
MTATSFVLVIAAFICVGLVGSFSLNPQSTHPIQPGRRDFIKGLSISIVPLLSNFPDIANASGGATAGGAYLLSAKQRYNDRVKEGITGYLALGPAVDNGDLDAIRSYFASDVMGNWKDLSTAGYLLANAFRRNSTAAPDSLPSVKVSQFLNYCFVRSDLTPYAATRLIIHLSILEMEGVCSSSGCVSQSTQGEKQRRRANVLPGWCSCIG